MAEKEKAKAEGPPPTKKSGCLKNVFMLALLALLVLGGLSYFTFEPQKLADIEGYEEESSAPAVEPRDLLAVLKNASEDGHSVKITEQEINDYIKGTLKFEQGGLLKQWVEARGVWVRLEDGVAEVVIERELVGKRRHTISMYLRPEQREDGKDLVTKVHRSSGRFGRIRVFRGFMLLVKSSFEELAAQYPEELKLVQAMFRNRVRITMKEGELELSAPEPAAPE